MKFQPLISYWLILGSLLFLGHSVFAQNDSISFVEGMDSVHLSKKEKRELKKKEGKEYIKGRRWRISTSFIFASINSSLAIEGPRGVLGARLGLEDQLGFSNSLIIPKFDFQYSFTPHSSLYAEYYNISRKSKFEVDEGFDWGDIEIPDNAGTAEIFLNTQIWSVGYMYSFVNKPDVEISFFANVFILGIYTGLDVEQQDIHNRFRLTAPLPSFGYRFNYEILPRVRFGGTHSFFFLRIGDYSGYINNFKLSLDYRIIEWMSLGASYSKFDLNVSSEANSFKGIIEYTYNGPGLYLQFVF